MSATTARPRQPHRSRTRYRTAPPPARAPHAFEVDWQTPPDPRDRRGRYYCLRCHLPGSEGDERHPVDAPRLFPAASEAAREFDAAVLGERS